MYERLRTADAVTGATGIWWSLAGVVLLYLALGVATGLVLRAMARRWRQRDATDADADVPYGPPEVLAS